jgi:hypothetical protein
MLTVSAITAPNFSHSAPVISATIQWNGNIA